MRRRELIAAFVTELTAKRIEIMHDLIARMSRIALLDNMENRSVPPQWNELKRAALAFGIQPLLCDVKTPEDIESAFMSASREFVDAGGLISYAANYTDARA
jgi:ABC-type uncharacterized transport system substrate-binding protein